MSRKSPNRRPACGKSSIDQKTLFWGGCAQPNTGDSGQMIYTNVTKVHGLGDGSNPTAPIDPYPRPNQAESPSCYTYYGYTCGDKLNGQYECYIPPAEEVDIVPTDTRVQSGLDTNSFVASEVTQSIKKCEEEIGWKVKYANKAWHGRFGFTSNTLSPISSMGWCCSCVVRNEYQTPDTTKYLSVSGEGSISFEGASGTNNWSANAHSSCTVNRYSGMPTTTCFSQSSFASTGEEELDAFLRLTRANDAKALVTAAEGFDINAIHAKYCSHVGGTAPDQVIDEGNSKTLIWYDDFWPGNPLLLVVSLDMSGHIEIDYYGARGAGSWGQTGHEEWHVANTVSSYSGWSEVSGNVPSLRSYSEKSATCYLGDEYTVAAVKADLFLLASQWDFGDDTKYPWRTDTDITAGPLVTFHERGTTTPQLFTYCETPPDEEYDGSIRGRPTSLVVDRWWNRRHPNYFICGDGFCDVKFTGTFGAYSTECHVPCATQWTTKWQQAQLPQGAFIGCNFFNVTPSSCTPDGGLIADDTLWLAEYAEIIQAKPSFNYAKPNGKERLQHEIGTNICVESASYYDRHLFLDQYNAQPTVLQTGDVVWVQGHTFETASFDGAWSITRNGDYEITLNTRIASASWFSTTPFEPTSTPWVAKMKWHGMAGIRGRVDIASISPTNPATASLLEPCHLFNGDTVRVAGTIVTGSRGIRSFDSFYRVRNVIDSQNVVLEGLNAESCSYQNGSGQMFSPFGIDWKYDDELPKGEYSTLQFETNIRQVGEYQRLAAQSASVGSTYNCDEPYYDEENDPEHNNPIYTYCSIPYCPPEPRPFQSACGLSQDVSNVEPETHCLPFNACKPSVAFFSPVSHPLLEQKYNCRNHGFGDVVIDNPYGSMWNGFILQYDTDYAWQAPPCSCSEKTFEESENTYWHCFCGWSEDNGTCQTDVEGDEDLGSGCTRYYTGRPYVEARTSLPAGAPTHYQDKVRVLTVGELNSSPCNSTGRVFSRPINTSWAQYHNYTPDMYLTPYAYIYLLRQGCVCGGGRFADEYAKGRISCNEVEI